MNREQHLSFSRFGLKLIHAGTLSCLVTILTGLTIHCWSLLQSFAGNLDQTGSPYVHILVLSIGFSFSTALDFSGKIYFIAPMNKFNSNKVLWTSILFQGIGLVAILFILIAALKNGFAERPGVFILVAGGCYVLVLTSLFWFANYILQNLDLLSRGDLWLDVCRIISMCLLMPTIPIAAALIPPLMILIFESGPSIFYFVYALAFFFVFAFWTMYTNLLRSLLNEPITSKTFDVNSKTN